MDRADTSSRERELYRVTLIGSVVNVLLTIGKFAAGIWGHSAAMVADAVHSLSDLVTDVIVIVFVRLSGKPEDKSHDYGHGKYETFATLLIGLALLGVAVGICWDGLSKIIAFFSRGSIRFSGMGCSGCCCYFRCVERNTLPLHLCRREKTKQSCGNSQCMASS